MIKTPKLLAFLHKLFLLTLLLYLSFLHFGCVRQKHTTSEKIFERGWIGGDYKFAHVHHQVFNARGTLNTFPSALPPGYKSGLLLTSLSTNTPARIGGLQEGDLIVAVDQQPVASLGDFRHIVDASPPGSRLTIRSIREGRLVDSTVLVGREKFKRQGEFVIALPLITRELDLWPNPGVSLIVLGYAPNPGYRLELASVESRYLKACEADKYHALDENWRAWLVIFQLSRREIILSQDKAEPSIKKYYRNSRELERAEVNKTLMTARQ